MGAGRTNTEEFVVPAWRNGKAFARTHDSNAVRDQIKEALLSEKPPKIEVPAAKAELDPLYPLLIHGLRITDLRDGGYWWTMILICLTFLVVELIAIIVFGTNSQKLLYLQMVVGGTLILPTMLLLIAYGFALWCWSSSQELPSYMRWCKPSLLHALPVLYLAIGLMAVNFWLVAETGWRQSPFLPAFLAATLAVIGLPRDNSWYIIGLSIIAGILGVYACLTAPGVDAKILKISLEAWGAGDNGRLPFSINALTFAVSSTLTITLRFFSLRLGKQG
ncbi:MAG: hypothetical protein HY322_20800 [Betaproteobacteria bacterium]|nr:hypothetical protein [Betaproteobacteria bacterium]